MFLDINTTKENNILKASCKQLRIEVTSINHRDLVDNIINKIEEAFNLECPHDFQVYDGGVEMNKDVVIECLNKILERAGI